MTDAKTSDVSTETCRLMAVKLTTAGPVTLSLYAEDAANFVRALATDRDRLATRLAAAIKRAEEVERQNADLLAANIRFEQRARDAERALANTREALRMVADRLDQSSSGYIPGSRDDEEWCAVRDDEVQEARSLLMESRQ